MKVFKYQATGNDFILTKNIPENPSKFAKEVSNRHFGIGADGILYPSESKVADLKMNYYNSDGSVAKMCGNGIRAFARFLYDEKLIAKKSFDVETLAGIKHVEIEDDIVSVNIGPANLNVGAPDLTHSVDALKAYNFNDYTGYVLSVGTLHAVVYIDQNKDIDIIKAGIIIQDHTLFTDQVNVNFIELLNDSTIRVKTFERGAGWTLSCGTGVSASVYHALLKGYVKEPKVRVHVPGGELDVEVVGSSIYLIGPAKRIMDGTFYETN